MRLDDDYKFGKMSLEDQGCFDCGVAFFFFYRCLQLYVGVRRGGELETSELVWRHRRDASADLVRWGSNKLHLREYLTGFEMQSPWLGICLARVLGMEYLTSLRISGGLFEIKCRGCPRSGYDAP